MTVSPSSATESRVAKFYTHKYRKLLKNSQRRVKTSQIHRRVLKHDDDYHLDGPSYEHNLPWNRVKLSTVLFTWK